jgi:hypothetical protein
MEKLKILLESISASAPLGLGLITDQPWLTLLCYGLGLLFLYFYRKKITKALVGETNKLCKNRNPKTVSINKKGKINIEFYET